MYDYIIVGAGSAGCVLADRLSADGRFKVALIEAGGRDWNPFVHMPAGIAQLMKFPGLNWNYETEPEPALNQRRLWWPRGKVWGGSSSINAMCYIRGHAGDYDDWARLGNVGWSFDEVLPYFKRSECNSRGADPFHGDSGPLSVSDLKHVNQLSHAFVEAAESAGFLHNSDFNGAMQEGFGLYQVTQRDGRRCSTASSFLKRAQSRANFELLSCSQVLKVLIKGSSARGVQVCSGNSVRDLQAAREVILSGGSINSPQLLMLSGVGDSEQLARQGIATRVRLPGVGANLQDHLDICTLRHCTKAITYDRTSEVKVALEYMLTKGGIGSSNIAEAGGFARSRYASERPDLQFHFVPAFLDDHGRNRLPGNGFTVHACQLRPQSRGHIELASNDPQVKPRIFANYLSVDQDRRVLLEGLKFSREIFAQLPLREFAGAELFPGAEAQSEAELSAFLRRKAETIYHPVGTCRMGVDEHAVVDPQLRVHGAQKLRVVDASVMPSLIGGNTNAPTVMIAEKASDMILAAAAQRSAA